MCAIQYNIQLEKLCTALQLGKITAEPTTLSGGFLHRMYALETTQGKYAVKALNPQIMLRPEAKQRYILAEQIANAASKNITALPAKEFGGVFLQELDNQTYLVFDWADGKCLNSREINLGHCKKIGVMLAAIHNMDYSQLHSMNHSIDKAMLTDWNYYLQKGETEHAVWTNLLSENLDNLYTWNVKAKEAASHLASDQVISHRDLDPKNVIWDQDKPIIIDWEAAGSINPMQELTETAIYWAEDDEGNLEKERFLAFIDAYKKHRAVRPENWKIALQSGFLSKIGWLEYSLKRSLGIECTDQEEQDLGTVQAAKTIITIREYADKITQIEKWLCEEV